METVTVILGVEKWQFITLREQNCQEVQLAFALAIFLETTCSFYVTQLTI